MSHIGLMTKGLTMNAIEKLKRPTDVGSGGLVGLLARMLCKLGIHKIRRIRVTHYNSWSGDECERCGASRSTFERVFGRPLDPKEKRDLDKFYRVAGGNKLRDREKQPNVQAEQSGVERNK